jgi:hypothetical protein
VTALRSKLCVWSDATFNAFIFIGNVIRSDDAANRWPLRVPHFDGFHIQPAATCTLASGHRPWASLGLFTFVARFVLIFGAVALLLPSLALAKRVAPAKVEPVIYQGVRYIAPNDDGRRAYIEARDVQTNKKLWDLTIFTNRIEPTLEEDVQWVFIKAINVRDGALIVTSERDEIYRIDLKTKAVTQSTHAQKGI